MYHRRHVHGARPGDVRRMAYGLCQQAHSEMQRAGPRACIQLVHVSLQCLRQQSEQLHCMTPFESLTLQNLQYLCYGRFRNPTAWPYMAQRQPARY